MYYVYALFDWQGIPRYIGKGKGNRWLHHERRRDGRKPNYPKIAFLERTRTILGDIPKIKIRDSLTEDDAFAIEVAFIKAIGRLDKGTGPLTNMSDGGDGTMDQEQRKANGKKAWPLSIGKLTPAQRLENGRKAAESRRQNDFPLSSEATANLRAAAANARTFLKHETMVATGKRNAAKARSGITPASWEKQKDTMNKRYTPEQRREWGRKSAAASFQTFTHEQRQEYGRMAWSGLTPQERRDEMRRRMQHITKEQRREAGLKGLMSRWHPHRKLQPVDAPYNKPVQLELPL